MFDKNLFEKIGKNTLNQIIAGRDYFRYVYFMLSWKTLSSPKLDKPGAGLPWYEALAARYILFPKLQRSTSWQQGADFLTKENHRILNLIEGRAEVELSQRVLIPRIRGMEDSSRYWSVAMTLEHLLITGRGMSMIASELSQGVYSDFMVDVALVKPQGQQSVAQILESFKEFTKNEPTQTLSQLKDRQAEGTKLHPWLGRLNAHGWFILMGMHTNIHRKQIAAILRSQEHNR